MYDYGVFVTDQKRMVLITFYIFYHIFHTNHKNHSSDNERDHRRRMIPEFYYTFHTCTSHSLTIRPHPAYHAVASPTREAFMPKAWGSSNRIFASSRLHLFSRPFINAHISLHRVFHRGPHPFWLQDNSSERTSLLHRMSSVNNGFCHHSGTSEELTLQLSPLFVQEDYFAAQKLFFLLKSYS